MTNDKQGQGYAAILVIAVVAIIALVYFMQRPTDTSTRLGNAAEDMAEGVEDAARELDPNRTTGERIGETVEDIGEDIQDASQ